MRNKPSVQMAECSASKFVQVFETLKQHGIHLSLELNTGSAADPFISLVDAEVKTVSYDEFPGGPDSISIGLGENYFSLDLSHQFSILLTDQQVMLCAVNPQAEYAIWFNSNEVTPEGIAEIRKDSNHDKTEIVECLSEQLLDYYNLNPEDALGVAHALKLSLEEFTKAEITEKVDSP